MSLGVEKLIGPRIVAADTVNLDGSGDGSVKLPKFDGSATDYVVMALDADATAAAAVAASLAMDTTSTTITFKGPASGAVQYSVVKKGLAV